MKLSATIVIALLLPFTLFSQSYTDSLTLKLEKIQKLGYLPGFAVAIVSEEGVHYQKGFGFADVKNHEPFTVHSLENIGSISKTLIGIALMQLVEEGKVELDAPINDFLPFKIINPRHPEVPITIQHLATHTSSIKDPWEYEKSYLFSEKLTFTEEELPKGYMKYIELYNQNTDMSVEAFIKSMHHVDGEWYSKKNFGKKKPGTSYEYSNMGATIAGVIVEQVSGIPYQEYTKERILKPMKMENSGWTFDDIDESKFVQQYLGDDLALPRYEIISYADGGLISSVNDLALYFSKMIKGYYGGESGVLSAQSIKTMMDSAYVSDKKSYGIFWSINGKAEYGHSGADPGILTIMMFDPKTGIGRMVFTNKFDEGDGFNQFVYVWKTLEKYMDKIAETVEAKVSG